MPTIFRENGIRYFLYSNEGTPREPMHIHAIREACECKIMIDPSPRIVRNSIFRPSELRDILRVVNSRRVLSVPLNWFPRLSAASAKDRKKFSVSQRGIHWADLDEDISIEGLLAGRGDQTRPPHRAA